MYLKVGIYVQTLPNVEYAGKIVRRNLYNPNLWVVESFNSGQQFSWNPANLIKMSDEEAMIHILENS